MTSGSRRAIFEGYRTYLRFVSPCDAMCKLGDMTAEAPCGWEVRKRLAAIGRPDFDEALDKRGLTLPQRPKALPTAPPERSRPALPEALARALNPPA